MQRGYLGDAEPAFVRCSRLPHPTPPPAGEQARTSMVSRCSAEHELDPSFVLRLKRRLSREIKMPVDMFELTEVQYYSSDMKRSGYDFFKPHFDSSDAGEGSRIATLIMYLGSNRTAEGGDPQEALIGGATGA